MRLADDEITVNIGRQRLTLRPTLRAATRLERLHHGYQELYRRVLSGHLDAIATVIIETATPPLTLATIHDELKGRPLGSVLPEIMAAAAGVLLQLVGHDPDRPADPDAPPASMTFRKLHKELFRVATGALGWPPETAWNATLAEIAEAHRGRADLLRSIFGGEAPEDKSGPDLNATLDRAGLDSLRGQGKLT